MTPLSNRLTPNISDRLTSNSNRSTPDSNRSTPDSNRSTPDSNRSTPNSKRLAIIIILNDPNKLCIDSLMFVIIDKYPYGRPNIKMYKLKI